MATAGMFFKTFEADSGSLWLRQEESLHCAMVFSRSLENLNGITLSKHDGLAGTVVKERHVLLLSNFVMDSRSIFKDLMSANDYSTYLGAPIFVDGTVLGVLSYYLKKDKMFTAHDAVALELVCDMLGLAITNCCKDPLAQAKWLKIFHKFSISWLREGGKGYRQKDEIFYSNWFLLDDYPKGIHPLTLEQIKKHLRLSAEGIETRELAVALGISLSTARRYLNYLEDKNIVLKEIVYQKSGHPRYLWYLQ